MENSLNKYAFVIETFKTFGGGTLKEHKPDKDGYYKGIPIAVIGKPSDNNAKYDVPSFVNSMKQNPFYRILTMGGLKGEVQHPDIPAGKLGPKEVHRLCKIEQTLVATHFEKIYTAEELDNGGLLVRADMKPYGPYGQYTEEMLRDPRMGAAWSLRALCSEKYDQTSGYKLRKIGRMVTFDNADSGGYPEASKYLIKGTESISEIDLNDFYVTDQSNGELVAACEEVKDLDLLNAFGVKEMVVETKKIGLGINDTTYREDNKHNVSIFHKLMESTRKV